MDYSSYCSTSVIKTCWKTIEENYQLLEFLSFLFYGTYLAGQEDRVSGTPRALRIMERGQNLVIPNWKRLAPTKAVKKSQYGW